MSTRQHKLNQMHLVTAYTYSILSHCERSKVGAVIVRDNRIISIGYNGLPSNSKCDTCENLDGTTKDLVVHAEMNAIAFAAKHGVSIDGCSLFVTLSPCSKCAAVIAQSGIKKIFYSEPYRCELGLEILKSYGIEVNQIRLVHTQLDDGMFIKW